MESDETRYLGVEAGEASGERAAYSPEISVPERRNLVTGLVHRSFWG